MEKNKCEKGYHYHPKHLKADDANGCMKDEDMIKRENFKGTNSIYNAVRNVGQSRGDRSNDLKSYIGVV